MSFISIHTRPHPILGIRPYGPHSVHPNPLRAYWCACPRTKEVTGKDNDASTAWSILKIPPEEGGFRPTRCTDEFLKTQKARRLPHARPFFLSFCAAHIRSASVHQYQGTKSIKLSVGPETIGSTCQISWQYSWIARSDENLPILAVFRMDFLAQVSGSQKTRLTSF